MLRITARQLAVVIQSPCRLLQRAISCHQTCYKLYIYIYGGKICKTGAQEDGFVKCSLKPDTIKSNF